jgi:site-specific DNA-methyltransferase (adenine-specific)
MTQEIQIACEDAVKFIASLESNSVHCIICDPPFGLGEDTFDKHYARDKTSIVEGYVTAPQEPAEYQAWAAKWIHEFPRILSPKGTAYIVCAWNHLTDIELAIRASKGLQVLNHIIWKYNFGVYTQKKFVTSHYHILRLGIKGQTPAFYPRAYFTETDLTATGHKAQYADMEDVWTIPKEYAPNLVKNINKLPDALVEKMIRYSTKPGDTVADFFLGNFTTAFVARRLGRRFKGCEINSTAFEANAAAAIATQPVFIAEEKGSTKPDNAGKPITDSERTAILERFKVLHQPGVTKKAVMETLEAEFKRGHFSLVNILKAAAATAAAVTKP